MEFHMPTPQYPIDWIDIRDKKRKLASTVVKWWNVNYVMTEVEDEEDTTDAGPSVEVEDASLTADDDALAAANEIFERLERERLADEAAKQAEIDAAKAAADDQFSDSDYNAATGSYSGAYGRGQMNDLEASQVSQILGEKKDAISDLIKGLTNVDEEGEE